MNCLHEQTETVPSGNKIHHSKMVCITCKKFIKWLPKPKEYTDNIVWGFNEPRPHSLFGKRKMR